MPLYSYKAVNREGETVETEREAPDEAALIAFLQGQGMIPIRISAPGSRPFAWLRLGKKRSGVGPKEVALFTRELLTLLQAGLPLDRALSTLQELTGQQPELHGMIGRILESVKGGTQFSGALEAQGGVFSRFYLNLIRAGEAGGALEQVLDRLSSYLERTRELRETVVTAMIYPAILLVMSVLVVPQFTELFENAGKELPVPTQIVIGVAQFLQNYWWLIPILVIGGISLIRWHLSDPTRRLNWDRKMLHLPLLGDLVRKVEVANFSRTLGTLLANGVSMLSAMTIVRETLDNRAAAEGIGFAIDSLKQGGGLSAPLVEAGWFPTLAVQMIKLGEESGHLAEMLDRIATTYDKEVRIAVQRLLTLLEPLLIVGLGILIAGIIISILMAILSVNDLAF
jgi:general secretion pathway protein F